MSLLSLVEFKKWKKGNLKTAEENLSKLEEKEKKALQKVKNSYEKSKEKATAKVAVGRMDKIKKKEVETMVAAWEPGDTEKGNDADSMKKLFLQAMLEETGGMLAKQTDKVKAAEVKPRKETEKETEETEDTKKPGNNEITTLFQLLHAENRNLRWK